MGIKYVLHFVLAQEHVGDPVLDGEDAATLAANELALNDIDLQEKRLKRI